MGGRSSKTQYVPKIEYRDKIVEVEKIIEKEVIKEVEKIVNVIINVEKNEFEQGQARLAPIMNNGYQSIAESVNNGFRTSLSVGSSGTGKSTTINLIYGTDFKSDSSVGDVTVEMSMAIQSPNYSDVKVIDTIGFLPSLLNFGKLFLLLFHKQQFPDYFLYPIANDRLVELMPLYQLVSAGFAKFMVVPFSANAYYSNVELLVNMDIPIQTAKEKSKENAFKSEKNVQLRKDIEVFISAAGLYGNVVTVNSFDDIPQISGSMKVAFLNHFFKDGKFITMSYEQYKEDISKTNDVCSAVALVYGLLLNAVKCLPKFANFGSDGLITSINEVQFLKG